MSRYENPEDISITIPKEILVKEGTAYGVKTADGTEYTGKVVISNANAFDTFKKMMNEDALLAEYVKKWENYSVSISSFQVIPIEFRK